MRLLVVNPNTTASMTRKIGAAATRAAVPGTEIVAVNPRTGPVSIEGYFDEAISVPGLLDVVRHAQGIDGVVVACFDDTGLDAVRCLTAAPVIGIGEAGFHFASVLSNKFSVVTTLSRSVPAIEHNLVRYGLAHRCARVRASDVPVLDLEKGDPESRAKIARGDPPRHRRGPRRGDRPRLRRHDRPRGLLRRRVRLCPSSTASPAPSPCAKASPASAYKPPSAAVTPPPSRSPRPHKSKTGTPAPPASTRAADHFAQQPTVGHRGRAWRVALNGHPNNLNGLRPRECSTPVPFPPPTPPANSFSAHSPGRNFCCFRGL